MSNSKYWVGARVRWGPRAESVGDCADRLFKQLTFVQGLHQDFRHWSVIYRKKSVIVDPADRQQLNYYLLDGVHYFDFPRNYRFPMLDMGYSVRFYAEITPSYYPKSDYARWTINLHCASFCSIANQCGLGCENGTAAFLPTILATNWRKAMTGMIPIWDPDYGRVLTPAGLDENIRLGKKNKIFNYEIGWYTFLSSRLFPELPPLPDEALVKPYKKQGWLIDIYPLDFPNETKKELQRLKEVRSVLDDHWLKMHKSLRRKKLSS